MELQYCPTEEMIADILTKGLSRDPFIKLRLMSELIQMPDFASLQVRKSVEKLCYVALLQNADS